MKKQPSFFTVLIFFIVLITIGGLVYKDFGVPYDDPTQAQIAAWNYRYIFKGDPTLLTFPDRYYGVTFELPLLWIEARLVGPNYNAENLRHLLLYLLFLASVLIFYFTARRLFRSAWWGLLAAVFLVASPRIFIDAFYNSKDIPFMEMFVLAIGTLLLFLGTYKKKRGKLVAWVLLGVHALASGLLIDTRIAGIAILPISLVLLLAMEWGFHETWKHGLATLSIYLALSAGFTILFWPILWHDPVGEFLNAFRLMSHYMVYGKVVPYLGKEYSADALPWHYLPVWIGISTPLIILPGILAGFLDWILGALRLVVTAVRDRLRGIAALASDADTLGWLAVVAWLVIPLIAVYAFHSALYNGWRQMYFIYPPLVLLSTRGFLCVYRWFVRRTGRSTGVLLVTLAVLIAGLVEPIDFMIRYTPYASVYFNSLAGDRATLGQRFELDYWGMSYKPAMDYILARDPSSTIRLFVADTPGLEYYDTSLAPEPKSRLVMVRSQDEYFNYFIGDFQFHPSDYYPSEYEYYSISVRGTKIIVVYRVH